MIFGVLSADIIEISNSPYYIVIKKSSAKRLVMNFRQLNSHLVPIKYPIPRIDEILNKLSGYQVFSVCDFKSGFFQSPLEILNSM